jgi:hypothetical protein
MNALKKRRNSPRVATFDSKTLALEQSDGLNAVWFEKINCKFKKSQIVQEVVSESAILPFKTLICSQHSF